MPAMPLSPLKSIRSALKVDVLPLIAGSVICTDIDGRILDMNKAAERCFGYGLAELVGHPVERLLPKIYRSKHSKYVRKFSGMESLKSHLMGTSREVVGRRKNGEEFPVEAMVSCKKVEGRTILTFVNRDITERKELEALREIVAHEIDDRLKNILSVVTCLISLSSANASTIQEFKDSLIRRARALANSHLRQQGDTLPVILVTGSGDISTAVQAMRSDASDFIERPVSRKDLIDSIERSVGEASQIRRGSCESEKVNACLARLTARQKIVLEMVLAGQPSKNIATDLGISQRTVESHRAQIMHKLEVRTIPELVRAVLAAPARKQSEPDFSGNFLIRRFRVF